MTTVGTWVLLVFIHVGTFGSGNGVTTTTIDGFKSESACMRESRKISSLTNGTTRVSGVICINTGG